VVLSATSEVPLSGIPVVVDWALEEAAAGLRSYELEYRIDDGDWRRIALANATASSARHVVPSGHEVRYRVRGIDRDGEVGDWRNSRRMIPTALSDSATAIRWAGTWAFVSNNSYLGKRAHWSKASSANGLIAFEGTGIAWAGPVGPTRGQARIYIDGKHVATVDTHRSVYRARDVIWATMLEDGPHTLRIVVVGTRGRPTVAVDGVYLLREK
jgi:hypothetical protein